ncbi:MAG TPA: hypothetical protein VF533_08680 [Solirubrobacteraceae bacterium]|jgi:hypothetical protein
MHLPRRLRCGLPVVLGFACLIVALSVGPVAAWLLFIVAFALILDGVTALWEGTGSTGNLSNHRQ